MPQLKEVEVVEVLGIPLFARDIPSAINLVIDYCRKGIRNNYCISATGAHGLVFAKKNLAFTNVLKSFFLNLPDGMPGVWIGRLKGASAMKRCYGPDFFSELIRSSAAKPVRHYFCGGNPGVAEALKLAVSKKFRNYNIVGTFCPPFLEVTDYDYPSIAKSINLSGADIVWIGLSTPKQELFANKLAKETNVSFIITVGAAFDFHTDRVKQAPALLQKTGLEWLYRLLMEPKRLYKRYLEIVPFFIYFNLKELLSKGKRKSLGN